MQVSNHVHPYVQYDRYTANYHETHIWATIFAKNSYTKFHENLTDYLVTDTRSLIDGQVGGHGLFLLHKEHLKLLYHTENSLTVQEYEEW